MAKVNFIDCALTAVYRHLPARIHLLFLMALWKTLRPFGLDLAVAKEVEIIEMDDGSSEVVEIARFVRIRRRRELVSG